MTGFRGGRECTVIVRMNAPLPFGEAEHAIARADFDAERAQPAITDFEPIRVQLPVPYRGLRMLEYRTKFGVEQRAGRWRRLRDGRS